MLALALAFALYSASPATPRQDVTLSGLVLDGSEVPLAGVRLQLGERTSTSDADGRFSLSWPDVGEKRAELQLTREGHARLLATVYRDGPAHDHEFVLPRVAPISGTLLTAEGAPAAGLHVRASLEGREDRRAVEPSDAQGRFRIEGLTREPWRLGFEGEATLLMPMGVEGGEVDLRVPVDLGTECTGRLDVRVHVPGGESASGVRLRVTRVHPGSDSLLPPSRQLVCSTENGRWMGETLANGDWDVQAQTDNAFAHGRASVSAGATTRLDLELDDSPWMRRPLRPVIEGVALESGTPLRVRVYRLADAPAPEVLLQEYLEIWYGGPIDYRAPGQSIRVELEAPGLRGEAHPGEGLDSMPLLPSTSLQFEPTSELLYSTYRLRLWPVDGKRLPRWFEFAGDEPWPAFHAEPGEYAWRLEGTDQPAHSEPGRSHVMSGGVTLERNVLTRVELQARPWSPASREWTLSGRIVDPREQPLVGVRVRAGLLLRDGLELDFESSRVTRETLTDDEGRFLLRRVPAEGQYTRVEASRPGLQTRTWDQLLVDDRAIEEDLEYTLWALHPIEGRLTDLDGEPLQGARFQAWSPRGGTLPATAPTDANGAFRIEGTTAGPWLLRVSNAAAPPFSVRGPAREASFRLLVPCLAQGGETDVRLYGEKLGTPSGSLQVIVRAPDGSPVNARSGIYPEGVWSIGMDVTRKRSGARVGFTDVPAGQWVLEVESAVPGMRSAAQPIEVRANQETLVVVTLIPGGRGALKVVGDPMGDDDFNGWVWLRVRSPALGDGVARNEHFGLVPANPGQSTIELPYGPLEIEAGGFGARFRRELLHAPDAAPLTVPWGGPGTVRFLPTRAVSRVTALLRLWRADGSGRPLWLRMRGSPHNWSPIGLDGGAWRYRLEYHPTREVNLRKLPVHVLEGSFALDPAGPALKIPFDPPFHVRVD